jgi:hypothetical protein
VTLAETREPLLLSRGAHATARLFEIESIGANPLFQKASRVDVILVAPRLTAWNTGSKADSGP